MSLMCPTNSCKAKSGMCSHEKMMMIAALMVAAFFLIRHFI